MNKIAITGAIGAGKSTVGGILQARGEVVICADSLVQQAIAPTGPAYLALKKLLGPKYLDLSYLDQQLNGPKGSFDTKKLGQKLFKDLPLLKRVEALLHPIVWELIKKEETNHPKAPRIFYELPLFFEKKPPVLFHTCWVLAINRDLQLSRLQKKRGFSLEDIRARERLHLQQAEKIKQANEVIWNNGSLNKLKTLVFKALCRLPLRGGM